MPRALQLTADFGTRFSVSIDTEEEFEWGGAFGREDHSLQSIPALAEGQRFFETAGVVPVYYVDAPVARHAATVEALGDAIATGRCDIGAHLHPWVTPPFVETISGHNSFAGNLPPEVEFAKLQHLRDLMRNALGVRPIAYRAGRYGIGPNTPRLLADAGFRFDSSVRPHFDYSDEGGPDFSQAPLNPYYLGSDERLVELPLTTVMLGWAPRLGSRLRAALPRGLRGLTARAGMQQRIALTPEGIPVALALKAIDRALEEGIRLLSISFHSPSLAPGHTPYVRNGSDLDRLYRWFDAVFERCAKHGVRPASLSQIQAAMGATPGTA